MIPQSVFIDIHTHKAPKPIDGSFILYNWIPENWALESPKTPYSLGVHPWYIDKNWQQKLQKLENLIKTDHSLMAIGETGLDGLCDTPSDLQETIFRAHLMLANKYKKPVIIHCVKAYDRLLAIIKKEKPSVHLIVHGFNQKPAIAENLLKADVYLSFGKHLEQANSNASQVIKSIGLNGLFFLETDDAAVSIEQVYQFAAHRLECDIELLKTVIQDRFDQLFNNNIQTTKI